MKNRVARRWILLLAVLVPTGIEVLIAWALPRTLGLPPGQYGVGMQVSGRWHIGYQMAELREGRIFSIGPIEVYMGPLMDR
jgi:hypothetical protein